MKGYNIYVALKVVHHKVYENLKSLLISTNCYKDLLIDLMISLLLLMNWKVHSYEVILVIVYYVIKMIYYKPVKIILDIAGIVEIMINIVVKHYSLSESIISN